MRQLAVLLGIEVTQLEALLQEQLGEELQSGESPYHLRCLKRQQQNTIKKPAEHQNQCFPNQYCLAKLEHASTRHIFHA
jgi:hypothetical protein